MIWHAVNRTDWRSRDTIQNFARFDVAHTSYNFHAQIIREAPHAKTRALIYTYPAILYASTRDQTGKLIPTQARSWRDYGNLFESAGLFGTPLPYLRGLDKRLIIDYPGTGMRYWLDLNKLDLTPYIDAVRPMMDNRYDVRPCDDADLQSVLSTFGQSGSATDINRDGITDDADLLEILMQYGNTVSHYPVFGYLERYIEGYFIDNFPEYIQYTTQAQMATALQIEGYERYCNALRAITPHARLYANVYEGSDIVKVSGTDDAPVFRQPAGGIIQLLDGVFFENWRWHWSSRMGTLPESKIRAIEQRVDWLVARGKQVILAVNLAYDDAGYTERLEAIEYALRRWGNQVRFSEFRDLYGGGRSVVEASRELALTTTDPHSTS